MYYIGIDWADQVHQVCVTDDTAALLASFKFSNTVEGFQRMEGRIKELGIAPDQCLVAIEKSTGLLVTYLLERGTPYTPLTPKQWIATGTAFASLVLSLTLGMPWSWPISCAQIGTCITLSCPPVLCPRNSDCSREITSAWYGRQ